MRPPALLALLPILLHPTRAMSPPSPLAPLLNSDILPSEAIPSSYIVTLRPGHSLQAHGAAVGRDLAPHVNHVYDFIREKVVYVGRPVDEALLEQIRGDPRVESVEKEPAVLIEDGEEPVRARRDEL